MSLLEQLGFKIRTHVGISISANNFIELVCIDKNTKAVVKYSSDNIKYNNSIREIVDYDEFTATVERLFEEAGLNPKECSVTLSLPNVHFGITSLDGTTETPFILDNIQADIEDLYIFKRNEPVISFTLLDNGITRGQKNIVFGAIQSRVVAKMMEIFDKLECDLVRIDNSYSSLLKTIQYCDRFNKYILPEEKTLIVLVTPNSCCAFFMMGPIITDLHEEPLAVKSFSSEEVYVAISKIATNSILKNSPKSLLLISETDEVNSEVLAKKLDFAGEVDCINKSLNNNEQFIEVYGLGSDIDSNMVSYMTIEAVGAAAADFDEYPLDINFVPKERVITNMVQVGKFEVPFDRYMIFAILGSILLGALIGVIIMLLLNVGVSMKKNTNEELERDITVFKRTIDKNNSMSKVDILPTMSKIVEQNKEVLKAYGSLSTDLPESIYVQKFVTQANGGIGILGEAKTSESVQVFVDNLKDKNSNLMLTKLSVNAQGDSINSKIPDGYTFEIKTPDKNVDFDDDIVNNMKTQQQYRQGGNARPAGGPPPSPII